MAGYRKDIVDEDSGLSELGFSVDDDAVKIGPHVFKVAIAAPRTAQGAANIASGYLGAITFMQPLLPGSLIVGRDLQVQDDPLEVVKVAAIATDARGYVTGFTPRRAFQFDHPAPVNLSWDPAGYHVLKSVYHSAEQVYALHLGPFAFMPDGRIMVHGKVIASP